MIVTAEILGRRESRMAAMASLLPFKMLWCHSAISSCRRKGEASSRA